MKPARLKAGDLVSLINPAGATYHRMDLEIVEDLVRALGLRVKRGRHVLDRYGYLAGRDEDRAADLNAQFADPEVKAVLAVRGGWGCSRILPLLDYDLIAANPKILMGYSDVTALLLGIEARTGLVAFHGPVGISAWNEFTTDHVRQILFEGKAVTLRNPSRVEHLVQRQDRILTLRPGTARGRLAGGNLSVLSALVGSGYLPDWKGRVLFLEEIDEQIFRVDRMLTQLKLAGILDRIAGLVFGKCTNCGPGNGYGSLTLEDVLEHHIRPLDIPAYSGAMIGHIESQFTLPVGLPVEIDAGQGTIRFLEPAVQ